jgi:hypothetical protein
VTVTSALDRAIGRLGDDRAEAQAIHSWRVMQEEQDGVVAVELLVPFDEACTADVPAYVERVVNRAKDLLPGEHERAARRSGGPLPRRFEIVAPALAIRIDEVRLRDILASEPISFDDLTYRGDEVLGIEPNEEQLS